MQRVPKSPWGKSFKRKKEQVRELISVAYRLKRFFPQIGEDLICALQIHAKNYGLKIKKPENFLTEEAKRRKYAWMQEKKKELFKNWGEGVPNNNFKPWVTNPVPDIVSQRWAHETKSLNEIQLEKGTN